MDIYNLTNIFSSRHLTDRSLLVHHLQQGLAHSFQRTLVYDRHIVGMSVPVRRKRVLLVGCKIDHIYCFDPGNFIHGKVIVSDIGCCHIGEV